MSFGGRKNAKQSLRDDYKEKETAKAKAKCGS
jgi:hypothetical protein